MKNQTKKNIIQKITLVLASVFCLFVFLAPPFVEDSQAAPDCFMEWIIAENGQACIACVENGPDLYSCECGSTIFCK